MPTIPEDDILISTTPSISGWKVTHYYGLVAGEAIIGANIFRDLFAGIRDIVGGRSGSYERGMAEAREIASAEIRKKTAQLGGNAVLSADVDYEVINNMLMVSISGTAVRLQQEVPGAS